MQISAKELLKFIDQLDDEAGDDESCMLGVLRNWTIEKMNQYESKLFEEMQGRGYDR